MEKTMRVTIDAGLVPRLRQLAVYESDSRAGVATVVNRLLRKALAAKAPARPARSKEVAP